MNSIDKSTQNADSKSVRVVIFGKPEDGFLAYPGGNYQQYYKNRKSAPGWLIEVKKQGAELHLIFARYHLRESLNGRTGACFGLAVRLHNCAPLSYGDFYEKLFKPTLDAFIDQGTLLARTPEGDIYFTQKNFRIIEEYLDYALQSIVHRVRDFFRGADALARNIPDGDHDSATISIRSDESLVAELFRRCGVVRFSSEAPLLKDTTDTTTIKPVDTTTEYFTPLQNDDFPGTIALEIRRIRAHLSQVEESLSRIYDLGAVTKLGAHRTDVATYEEDKYTTSSVDEEFPGRRSHTSTPNSKATRRPRFLPAFFSFLSWKGVLIALLSVVGLCSFLIIFLVIQAGRKTSVSTSGTRPMANSAPVKEASMIPTQVENEAVPTRKLEAGEFLDYAIENFKSVQNSEEFLDHIVQFLRRTPAAQPRFESKEQLVSLLMNLNSQAMKRIQAHILRNNKKDLAAGAPYYNNGPWRKTISGTDGEPGFILPSEE